jgi:hypothetical protein
MPSNWAKKPQNRRKEMSVKERKSELLQGKKDASQQRKESLVCTKGKAAVSIGCDMLLV